MFSTTDHVEAIHQKRGARVSIVQDATRSNVQHIHLLPTALRHHNEQEVELINAHNGILNMEFYSRAQNDNLTANIRKATLSLEKVQTQAQCLDLDRKDFENHSKESRRAWTLAHPIPIHSKTFHTGGVTLRPLEIIT